MLSFLDSQHMQVKQQPQTAAQFHAPSTVLTSSVIDNASEVVDVFNHF